MEEKKLDVCAETSRVSFLNEANDKNCTCSYVRARTSGKRYNLLSVLIEANDVHVPWPTAQLYIFSDGKEPIQIQHTIIGIAQTNVIILFVAIGDVKGQILIKRIYLIYVCFCIVVSNTYCVVILLCFSSSCVPYVASFSELSFFDCHSVLLYFM